MSNKHKAHDVDDVLKDILHVSKHHRNQIEVKTWQW